MTEYSNRSLPTNKVIVDVQNIILSESIDAY